MKLTNFLVILMVVILAVCAHAAPKSRGLLQFPGYGTYNPKGKLPVPFPNVVYFHTNSSDTENWKKTGQSKSGREKERADKGKDIGISLEMGGMKRVGKGWESG
ncbi:hypothetical protein M0802_001248 [Mischocyttarus mexicanus]|nr:hypothetical protein M0802_001248 [Mischocyttarus mexicanus]